MTTHLHVPNPHLLAFTAALAALPPGKRFKLSCACEIPSGQLAEVLCEWWQATNNTETPAEYIAWLLLPPANSPFYLKKAFACHV